MIKIFSILILLFFSTSILSNEAEDIRKINNYFYQWHPEKAKTLLDKLENSSEIYVIYLKARYNYLIGDYKKSKELLEYFEMNASSKLKSNLEKNLVIMNNAIDEISKYEKFVSDDKKFVVYTPKGDNEILGKTALKVLRKAYLTHSSDLEYKDNMVVRLEILPSIEVLAKMSGLTLQEIQTSGTIALCDDNKVMITSPKALVKGYNWLDTISHEFVHLIISKKTNNTTPIWIHEGIAKFQETRWRLKSGLVMEKYSESILATAHKKKHYITFQEMSPSLAKLPSQHDAALAYAQVSTLIDWTFHNWGYKRINKLLMGLKKFNSDARAVSYAYGLTLNQLLNNWKKYLDIKKYKIYEGLITKPLIFKTLENKEDKLSEIKVFKNSKFKKFLRLGNMLYDQNRIKSAKIEYLKALKHKKYEYPYLENRLSEIYLNEKMYKKVIDLLTKTIDIFPDYVDTYMNLGIAYYELNNYDKSEKMFNMANMYNPFLVEIHEKLLDIYKKLKKNDLLNDEKWNLNKLTPSL
jgi:tetratricopeptide (TPR) repeat protein